MRHAPLALLILSGCWPFIPGSYDDYVNSDAESVDTDPDVDIDVDTDPDPDTDTDTDTDPDVDTDTDTQGPCVDDGNEPNDTAVSATLLQDGTTTAGMICPDDPDYFRVTIPEDCEADIQLSFNGSAGDLDLYLYEFDTSTQVSWSDHPSASTENITYTGDGGAYIIVVDGRNGSTTDYTLDVDIDCEPEPEPSDCIDDAVDELGNDDTQANASDWDLYNGVVNRRICEGDSDWYQLNIPVGCTIDIRARHVYSSNPINDIDLQLVNASGTVMADAQSTRSDETIDNFYISVPVWLHVYGFRTTESPYELQIVEDCP